MCVQEQMDRKTSLNRDPGKMSKQQEEAPQHMVIVNSVSSLLT